MNGHTKKYCWDKWGKCDYAHQVYNENEAFTSHQTRFYYLRTT